MGHEKRQLRKTERLGFQRQQNKGEKEICEGKMAVETEKGADTL